MGGIALIIYVISSFHQGSHTVLFIILGMLTACSFLVILLAVNQFRKAPAELPKNTAYKPDKKLESIVRQYDELAERHIALAQELEDAKIQNTELIKKLESTKTLNTELNHEVKDGRQKYSELDHMINILRNEQNALSEQINDLSDRIKPIDQINKKLGDILESLE